MYPLSSIMNLIVIYILILVYFILMYFNQTIFIMQRIASKVNRNLSMYDAVK